MTGSGRVAIVGLAGRFPGAEDVGQFWDNLAQGVESIVELDTDELDAAGVAAAEYGRDDYVRAASPLHDHDRFDAAFFGYTPREAEVTDPQHRIFLETAFHALEDAGYPAPPPSERVGVFGGAGSNGYLHHVYTHPEVVDAVGRTQVLLGNEVGFLAPRVSYKLDLRGPAVSLRTACSTSLVAVHLATRSLLDRECELAIAGGAFLNLVQDQGYRYQEGGFMSPDGHCRPFDAAARGTVFGSGVGAVVLKPLEAALADRDTVYAVLLGSAINNDGAGKVGFTAPAVEGQHRVIADALARAGVDGASVDYIETHGTGTPLGDPVEFQALARAYGTDRERPCVLGSVKSNIGHLDAASGVAGLIKLVLALGHELMPPTLHFRRPNPAIPLAESGFDVRAEATPWPRGDRPRRGALSAFGFGGTNAHLVLEEAPLVTATADDQPERGSDLLVLSARSLAALEAATDRLVDHLHSGRLSPSGRGALADVAFTLGKGRQAFEHRRAVVADDAAAAAEALAARDPRRVWTRRAERAGRGVAFLLSGQGSQHPGMARELYEREPVFRASLDECLESLRAHLRDGDGAELDLRAVLLPTADADDAAAAETLRQTALAQPALFSIEYALARLWQSWGVTPSALLGHSLGELTAACLAGVFELDDALALVALRGRLMQACPPGCMLSVAGARDELADRLPVGIALAAHNGARDCVVSGAREDVDAFARQLDAEGRSTHAVATSHAFHSALMAGMVEPFVHAVAGVARKPPSTRLVSNVTGTWMNDEQAVDPQYWGRHVLATVEFSAGLDTLLAEEPAALLEVGPGQVLSGLARRALATGSPVLVAASLPRPREQVSSVTAAQRALGQLWASGVALDWDGYHRPGHGRVPLPNYPFERERFWLDLRLGDRMWAAGASSQRQPDPADWFRVPTWSQQPAAVRPVATGDRWLIFADEHGLGAALAARLRDAGALVDLVRAGAAFTTDGDGYAVRADSAADHEQLLAALTADAAAAPTRVVHCWNVTGVQGAVDVPDSLDGTRRTAFDALLALAQSWPAREPVRVWVVTDGLHRIVDTERLAPAKALVLGACRVAPREYEAMSWAAIDIETDAAGNGTPVDPALVERLLVECLAPEAEGTLAYRGRTRWVQGWTRHALPELSTDPAAANGPAVTLRGHTVLITGGLGAVGLELAEHLAAPGTNLVLVGRRHLPDPTAWDAVAAGTGAAAGTARRLRRIEQTGAQVLVCRADVADAGAMRAAVEAATARFGPIEAIVHAAGLPGGGLIQVKKLDEARAVLRPKVDGLLVLDALVRGGGPAESVTTMVLIGSNAANLGDFGQIDYAAANSVLDAYAHARNGRRRVVTLDYASWRRVGMAVDTPVPDALVEVRRNDLEVRGMEPEEALDAMDRVLAWSGSAQVAVTPVDLDALIGTAFRLSGAHDDLAGLRGADDAERHPRPELASGFVEPRGHTERVLCAAWENQLGLDRVGVHDSFFDLGGNSLIALSLTQAATEALGVRLTVVRLYEALTVARLAEIVDGHPGGDAPAAPTAGAAPAAAPSAPDTTDLLEERRRRTASRREHQRRRHETRGR